MREEQQHLQSELERVRAQVDWENQQRAAAAAEQQQRTAAQATRQEFGPMRVQKKRDVV